MLSADVTAQIDSPALVIFKKEVQSNIDRAIAMAGDISRLRPHVKTNKSPDATQLMLASGICQFKCATIAEAEMLAHCNAPDVLLAYQPIGPKLRRLVELMITYPVTRFSCLTDHPDAARELAAAGAAAGLEIPVYIDLNLGMNRTGIALGDAAFELYQLCHTLEGIRPVGVQAYDGHLRQRDITDRTVACEQAWQPVENLRQRILSAGFEAPVVIAGGSPTFPIHAQRPDVQCSPGTFIYWDKGYGDLCPEQPFQPAAWLMTRVVSLPDPEHICLDLGHKSVGAENPLAQRVFFENAPDLKPVSQSEEHLVMFAGTGHSWKIGDVLWGIPFHICPTVALYDRAVVIEDDRVAGYWPAVGRDRRITV